MANVSPYEVNATFSDDEAFAFCVSFEMADGTPFPFDDYDIEYSVRQGGGTRLSLTQSDGITVTAPAVSFDGGNSPLRKGSYDHGCRLRHIATGRYLQLFTGTVTIGEGDF